MYTEIQDFVVTFTSILWEAMPFIVLGAVVAGVLEEVLPQELMGRIAPKSAVPAAILGGLLGLVFPMCECGIVVVMRRLLRKGLPLACCISYMLAGPILNVVVILSTYVAFGGLKQERMAYEMVALRCGLGFVVAVVTGCVVHFLEKKHGAAKLLTAVAAPPAPVKGGLSLGLVEDAPEPPKPRQPLFTRLGNISQTALHDFLDITVFLILGATLAALAKLYIDPNEIVRISQERPLQAIPLMMALAVVMCLCSEADAFVAASFRDMTASSQLAFLVLGPMLDLKLLLMYTRVFKPRLIAVIVTCTVTQVLAYSLIVHTLYTPTPPSGGGPAPAAVTTPATGG